MFHIIDQPLDQKDAIIVSAFSCFFISIFRASQSKKKLRLRDVESLTDHKTSMSHKDQSSRVEFEYRALGKHAERKLIVDPALADPEGDQGDNAQGGRGGETFKVLCFAVGIFGHAVGGDVEASETEETAKGEGGEEEVVERGAHADCD